MTAEEIRNAKQRGRWLDIPFYTGSFGVAPVILVEIAAQLAEINENLKKLINKGGK